MKVISKNEREIVLRFVRGEELVAVLEQFCAEEKIVGAWIEGLGACDEVELSYYDVAGREYKRKMFSGVFELLNLTGNIAAKNGSPVAHGHAMFSREDFSTFGGHVHRIRISGTGEVVVRKFLTPLSRSADAETGLWLLD